METDVHTIDEDADFLTIAQIFLQSNRRRLPVLRDGRLVGQVSRRDLLAAVLAMLGAERHSEQVALYLSAVMDPNTRPLLNRAADYARD
jgi:CBS domain-containing protein